jgi:hypothetical protein
MKSSVPKTHFESADVWKQVSDLLAESINQLRRVNSIRRFGNASESKFQVEDKRGSNTEVPAVRAD